MSHLSNSNRKALSWKARHVGDKFCAPACGRGCTLAEYLRASALADKIALRLGRGWCPSVHENLGWHVSIYSKDGRLKVHPFFWRGKLVDFSANLDGPDSAGGHWSASGKTPEAAVRKVVKAAKKDVARINATIAGL